mmetsp:Transcript_10316/g.12819  ORF Transcript_10316/g.12819 Transcript_10316/m.12819 type:complete len:139 (+) Transcript_10316:42-458(+)
MESIVSKNSNKNWRTILSKNGDIILYRFFVKLSSNNFNDKLLDSWLQTLIDNEMDLWSKISEDVSISYFNEVKSFFGNNNTKYDIIQNMVKTFNQYGRFDDRQNNENDSQFIMSVLNDIDNERILYQERLDELIQEMI